MYTYTNKFLKIGISLILLLSCVFMSPTGIVSVHADSDIEFNIVWNDNNDVDQLRPNYVDISIDDNGTFYSDPKYVVRYCSGVATTDSGWKTSLSLPTDATNATIRVSEVPNYSSSIEKVSDTEFTVTYTYRNIVDNNDIDIEVIYPEGNTAKPEIEVFLETMDGNSRELTIKNGETSGKIVGIPLHLPNGNYNQFTVMQVNNPDGFMTTMSSSNNGGRKLTLTLKKVNPGTKVMDAVIVQVDDINKNKQDLSEYRRDFNIKENESVNTGINDIISDLESKDYDIKSNPVPVQLPHLGKNTIYMVKVDHALDPYAKTAYSIINYERIINYLYANGEPAAESVVQEGSYSLTTGVFREDLVTGEMINLSNNVIDLNGVVKLPKVISPTISGYTPDIAEVPELPVLNFTSETNYIENVNVTYSSNNSEPTTSSSEVIVIFDDRNTDKQNIPSLTVSAEKNKPISANAAVMEKVTALQDANYDIVSGLDTIVDGNPITIVVDHQITVSENRVDCPIDHMIELKFDDGSESKNIFVGGSGSYGTRTEKDLVTGKEKSTGVGGCSYGPITLPVYPGYTAETLTVTGPNFPDTVVYHKDGQVIPETAVEVIVTFEDRNPDKQNIPSLTVTAERNKPISANAAVMEKVSSLQHANYDIVSGLDTIVDGSPITIVVDHQITISENRVDCPTDHMIELKFDDGSESKNIFVGGNGSYGTRTEKDLVTGKEKSTGVGGCVYGPITLPVYPGYTAETLTVTGPDFPDTVVYHKDGQVIPENTAEVTIIFEDRNPDKQNIPSLTVTAERNKPISANATVMEKTSALQQANYDIVSGLDTIVDGSPITIVVDHQMTISENRMDCPTDHMIELKFDDGSESKNIFVGGSGSYGTRTEKDLVTGKEKSTGVGGCVYGPITLPVYPGYTAETLTVTGPNFPDTVVYHKNGQVTPENTAEVTVVFNDRNPDKQNIPSLTVSAEKNKPISANTAVMEKVSSLQHANYDIVSGLDTIVDGNPITIVVDHQITISEDRVDCPTDHMIELKFDDGSESKSIFVGGSGSYGTRTEKDLVTGKEKSTGVGGCSYGPITLPVYPGYTAETLTVTGPNFPDTVVYHKNHSIKQISFIDVNTSLKQDLSTYNKQFTDATDAEIEQYFTTINQTLTGKGYKFETTEKNNNSIVYKFSHSTTTTSSEDVQNYSRTIILKYRSGNEFDRIVQRGSLRKVSTIVKDNVTNSIISEKTEYKKNGNESSVLQEYSLQNKNGYTPLVSEISEINLVNHPDTRANTEIVVEYVKEETPVSTPKPSISTTTTPRQNTTTTTNTSQNNTRTSSTTTNNSTGKTNTATTTAGKQNTAGTITANNTNTNNNNKQTTTDTKKDEKTTADKTKEQGTTTTKDEKETTTLANKKENTTTEQVEKEKETLTTKKEKETQTKPQETTAETTTTTDTELENLDVEKKSGFNLLFVAVPVGILGAAFVLYKFGLIKKENE